MSGSLIDIYHYLRAEAQKRVVNIYQFLRAKDQHRKVETNHALDLIEKGYIPNTSDWSRMKGTDGPVITDKPINGRYLFNREELPDEQPEPAPSVS